MLTDQSRRSLLSQIALQPNAKMIALLHMFEMCANVLSVRCTCRAAKAIEAFISMNVDYAHRVKDVTDANLTSSAVSATVNLKSIGKVRHAAAISLSAMDRR